jgi:hypothetical protein
VISKDDGGFAAILARIRETRQNPVAERETLAEVETIRHAREAHRLGRAYLDLERLDEAAYWLERAAGAEMPGAHDELSDVRARLRADRPGPAPAQGGAIHDRLDLMTTVLTLVEEANRLLDDANDMVGRVGPIPDDDTATVLPHLNEAVGRGLSLLSQLSESAARMNMFAMDVAAWLEEIVRPAAATTPQVQTKVDEMPVVSLAKSPLVVYGCGSMLLSLLDRRWSEQYRRALTDPHLRSIVAPVAAGATLLPWAVRHPHLWPVASEAEPLWWVDTPATTDTGALQLLMLTTEESRDVARPVCARLLYDPDDVDLVQLLVHRDATVRVGVPLGVLAAAVDQLTGALVLPAATRTVAVPVPSAPGRADDNAIVNIPVAGLEGFVRRAGAMRPG